MRGTPSTSANIFAPNVSCNCVCLYRLLRIPNKDWTDLTGAQVYGSLFNQGITDAERKARGANTGVARTVKYGGTSGAWRTRRRQYGSGG